MPGNGYVRGSFILTLEHIKLSELAGSDMNSLIEEALVNLEIDLLLIPNSLTIYHIENRKDYIEYFYTEVHNEQFLRDFNFKMRGGNLMIDPILN